MTARSQQRRRTPRRGHMPPHAAERDEGDEVGGAPESLPRATPSPRNPRPPTPPTGMT
jgi:hypothetical protein